MKPISIKFKNWGPYTKEVFIPFDATSTLSSLGAIKEVMKDNK